MKVSTGAPEGFDAGVRFKPDLARAAANLVDLIMRGLVERLQRASKLDQIAVAIVPIVKIGKFSMISSTLITARMIIKANFPLYRGASSEPSKNRRGVGSARPALAERRLDPARERVPCLSDDRPG